MNVRDFGAVADGVTDDSPAFQAAHDAVQPTGGTILVPRGVYGFGTPLRLAPDNPGWVRLVGEGVGATVIRGVGGNGQLTQFGKLADWDTFRNIEIADLTFDGDNQVVGRGHVLMGVWPWHKDAEEARPVPRMNIDEIAIRRVRVINVPAPVDKFHTLFAVHLSGYVFSLKDTRPLTITNVRIEDVRVDGCSCGFIFIGSGRHGPIRGGSCQVFFDDISLVRCRHDTLLPPTPGWHANYQLGGVGYGGSVRVRDCYGANSGDVGLEVEGFTEALVEGCTMVDSWKNNFLIANFRRPESLDAQRYALIGCTAISRRLDPDIAVGPHHYGLQGNADTPHFEFGHLLMIGCKSRFDTPLKNFSVRGGALYAASGRFRQLTVRDFDVGIQSLATENAAAEAPSLIDIAPVAETSASLDGVRFRLTGTRSGTGKLSLRFIRLAGQLRASVDRVTVDVAVTGMTPQLDCHRIVDIGDLPGSRVRASLRSIRIVGYASEAEVLGIFVNGTATLTIPRDSRIVAAACDFSAAPAGRGADYYVHPTQRGRFVAREIAGQRTSGGSGPPTGPVELVPSQSPFVYVNGDNIEERLLVSGGIVGTIEYSDDNSKFFPTGLSAGVFDVGPGQALRVPYTAVPTIVKMPAR